MDLLVKGSSISNTFGVEAVVVLGEVVKLLRVIQQSVCKLRICRQK